MAESEEEPERCPLIDVCAELVSKAEFEGLCNTRSWTSCENARFEAIERKLIRMPREWKE